MKNGRTELVFILDRSGSMSGLESDTIGGYNGLLERHKQEHGEVLISTVLFDDQVELLHDRVPIRDVAPMTSNEYFVRGTTALLDAVGKTITDMERVHRLVGEANRPEHVLVVITTDGMENASREFSYQQVHKLVTDHQSLGWEFIFLGANIDAVAKQSLWESGQIGHPITVPMAGEQP